MTFQTKGYLGCFAALALALALTACTSTVSAETTARSVAEETGVSQHTATPPTSASAAPSPVKTIPSPTPVDVLPAGCGVGGYAIDSGPAPMANGTVERDSEGRPIAYVVAEGDAPQAIEKRLCVTNLQARNGLNRYIEVGERLTIDPTVPIP